MNKIFIAEAHAEDYAKTCIFAGWLANYSKYGKAIKCDISSIKTRSNNYKTNFLTNKDKAPTNQCNKSDQVPCQPMLFGTDSNGKLFCVDRSTAGTYYTNASANCRDLSKKANNYAEIIKNIIKNPKDFLELLKAIQKLCLCDVDGPQNSNEYRNIILKDGTCRSLVQQLKNLFTSTDYTKLNLTCSPDEIELSDSLKEVMPVVNAFDMNKKFLDERTRVCSNPPPPTPVIVTPVITPGGSDAISIKLSEPIYTADKKTAEVKIEEVKCPGLNSVNDIGTKSDTECEVNWYLKSDGASNEAKDDSAKNSKSKIITITDKDQVVKVELSYKDKKASDNKTVNKKAQNDDPGISIKLSDPIYNAEKKTAEVKIEQVTCPGLKSVDDIGTDSGKHCEINWYLKSDGASNEAKDDSAKNSKSKIITITDKDQVVKVELSYKDKKASDNKTVKTKAPSDDPNISIDLGGPNYSATNSAEVKITDIKCPGLEAVDKIGTVPECIVNWYLKSVEEKEDAKDESKEGKDKNENKTDQDKNNSKKTDSPSENDLGSIDESSKDAISKTITLTDKEQIITAELTYKTLKASSSQTIKKQEKAEDKPTPTPTASPSPSPTPAEEEESDPIPPQQQPQIPLGIPEQPMLLPGVI